MGKAILPAYRGFTAQAIKDKASIPIQTDMTVVGSNVEASVNLYQIRDALGISALDFAGQANSGAVNPWSGFGPTQRRYSNGGGTLNETLINEVLAPHGIFEFAGYNHTAPAPAFDHIYHTANVVYGDAATFDGYVSLGEINYPAPAVAVAMTIWDGATLVAFGITPLSNTTNGVVFMTCDTSPVYINKTFTVRFFIIDSTTEFQQNGSNALCIVPNTTSYDLNVSIGSEGGANSVIINGRGNWGITPDSTQIGNYINFLDGKLNITNMFNSLDGDNSNLSILISIAGTGVVNNQLYVWRSSIDGTYYANTPLSVVDFVVGDGGAVNMSDWVMTINIGDEM